MSGCRIGFAGAGGVALRHARMLSDIPDVTLTAVTDPAAERAESFASGFGARAVPDLDDLLDVGVDAVYVCVPPFAHGPVEDAVVAAGLPMFVEKPLGLDGEVPARVAAAVAAQGLVTSVGHHWRYARPVRDAVRLLAGRQVRLVAGAWLDKVPPVAWWTRRDRSGGQVIEQAVHVLDLARLLAGEVTEVHTMVDGMPPVRRAELDGDRDAGRVPGQDVDGATAVVLRFASGAVGSLVATCLLRRKHRAGLEVYADGLALTLAEDGLHAQIDDADPQWDPVDPDEAKRAADRAFVDAVLGREPGPLVPYEEAHRTHQLACAIAESALVGAPVRVDR